MFNQHIADIPLKTRQKEIYLPAKDCKAVDVEAIYQNCNRNKYTEEQLIFLANHRLVPISLMHHLSIKVREEKEFQRVVEICRHINDSETTFGKIFIYSKYNNEAIYFNILETDIVNIGIYVAMKKLFNCITTNIPPLTAQKLKELALKPNLKEKLKDYIIFELDMVEKKKAIKECLNPKTNLGIFFYTKRGSGIFAKEPAINRGTLAELAYELRKIELIEQRQNTVTR